MKFSILDAHVKYFQENGFIQFEDLLPINILQQANKELKDIINSCPKDTCRRDLFRNSAIIKKIAFNGTIAFILKNLTKKQNFRLVFDQLIIKKENTALFPLDSNSCFQSLIGAVIINIDQKALTLNNLNNKNSLIFIKNSFFINPEKLDFEVFLLIAYGQLKTIYKQNTQDPYNNYLRNLGYNFGDLLKDALHPVVC